MKRLSTLIVLLGLVMGAMMTGCGEQKEAPKTDAGMAASNAAPAAPAAPAPSTNK